MAVNQKVTGKASSMLGGLVSGGGISLGTMLLSAAILAKLVDKEILGESQIGYGVMMMLLIGSFLGAEVSAGMIKRRRVMVCLLSGCVFLGILLAITALFFGGQYEAVGVTAMLIFGGCGCAIFVGMRQGRGLKHRKVRMRTR